MLRLVMQIVSLAGVAVSLVLGTITAFYCVGSESFILPYPNWFAALFFGSLLLSTRGGRRRRVPILLGTTGLFLFTTLCWYFTGMWLAYRNEVLGPQGTEEMLIAGAALLSGIAAAAILSALAARRGPWSGLAWGGGGFIGVSVFSWNAGMILGYDLFLMRLTGPPWTFVGAVPAFLIVLTLLIRSLARKDLMPA